MNIRDIFRTLPTPDPIAAPTAAVPALAAKGIGGLVQGIGGASKGIGAAASAYGPTIMDIANRGASGFDTWDTYRKQNQLLDMLSGLKKKAASYF